MRISLASDGLLSHGSAVEAGPKVIRIAKLLHLAGLATSAAEANRKLAEGAVSINNQRFTEKTLSLSELGETPALRLGRKALRVTFGN